MSFTYNLATTVGQLRLEIGDHTSGTGVRPDGSNFSDEELEAILTQEGDVLGRGIARACEILANAWATFADLTVGPRSEKLSQVAARFEKRAAALRMQYGGGSTGATAVGIIRADGYQSTSDPEASDEYDETGSDVRSEYMGTTVYVKVG
jgi:hypothetical protein